MFDVLSYDIDSNDLIHRSRLISLMQRLHFIFFRSLIIFLLSSRMTTNIFLSLSPFITINKKKIFTF